MSPSSGSSSSVGNWISVSNVAMIVVGFGAIVLLTQSMTGCTFRKKGSPRTIGATPNSNTVNVAWYGGSPAPSRTDNSTECVIADSATDPSASTAVSG